VKSCEFIDNPQKKNRSDALILFLQTIMIARVLKNELREKLRDVTSQSTIQSILVTRLNQIGSSNYDIQFFEVFLTNLISIKFNTTLIKNPTTNYIIFHTGYLISNLCHSLGILLSFTARSKISNNYSENMTMRFQSSDIEDVSPIVKYSCWIDLGIIN
jgi:hypothetical protein